MVILLHDHAQTEYTPSLGTEFRLTSDYWEGSTA